MNTQYYVGYLKNHRALIFRSNKIPTESNHPKNVLFAWGPYYTRRKATQVAMYQNYYIDNEQNLATPMWNGRNEDIFEDFYSKLLIPNSKARKLALRYA